MNNIILFLHLCLGLWFAYHIYTLRFQKIFSSFSIKSCVFSYLLILLCSAQSSITIFILGIYVPILLFITAEYILTHKRFKAFQNQFIILLDSVIVRMKMGLSFRESLQLSIDQIENSWIKESLKELQDRVVYAQNISTLPPGFHSAFYVLKKIHQDHHQPLTQLQYIRNNLKIELLFLKKAHQALLQIRLQSIIMSVLYLGVLVFVIIYTGMEFINLILFSLLLFVLGSIFIFTIGRKIKWTL